MMRTLRPDAISATDVSGSVEDGKSSVVLKADRDCCFGLAGERVEMRKGETRRMEL